MRFYLLLFLFAFLLSSCAALNHMPHSELIMFQEKELKGGERVKTRYAHGMASGTFDLSKRSTLLANEPDFNNVAIWPSVATHLIFMLRSGSAFSAAIGTGIGFDATFPVLKRFLSDMHLTQSFSTPLHTSGRPGIQTIIQRKLHDGNPFGLSVGIHYQFRYNLINDFQGIYNDCPEYSSYYNQCIDFIPRHGIGIRSVITFSSQPRDHIPSKMMFYGALSINYDLSLGFIYPMLSISRVMH